MLIVCRPIATRTRRMMLRKAEVVGSRVDDGQAFCATVPWHRCRRAHSTRRGMSRLARDLADDGPSGWREVIDCTEGRLPGGLRAFDAVTLKATCRPSAVPGARCRGSRACGSTTPFCVGFGMAGATRVKDAARRVDPHVKTTTPTRFRGAPAKPAAVASSRRPGGDHGPSDRALWPSADRPDELEVVVVRDARRTSRCVAVVDRAGLHRRRCSVCRGVPSSVTRRFRPCAMAHS